MSVRTYNPSVRVGNWNEDLCLEEDLLKDFLEKKQNGTLLIHKSGNLTSKILEPVALSCHDDGVVRFEDQVCLYNPSVEMILSINVSESQLHERDSLSAPCGVAASTVIQPCFRNTFIVKSADGLNKAGDPLSFGQQFILTILPDLGVDLKLASERATFIKNAKKSHLQEVFLSSDSSYRSHWQIVHFDPRQRLETEGFPIKANQKVVIKHCNTNQSLAVLPEFSFRTAFGREREVVSHTFLDSHKVEKFENHWIIVSYQESDSLK